MSYLTNLWLLPLAAALTAGLCLALIPPARRLGLVDHPGMRKVHETATPLTGGAALIVTLGSLGWWLLPHDRFGQALLAGATLMFMVGAVDDRWNLAASVRFLMQVVACAIMMSWADLRLDDFGPLFSPTMVVLGILSAPVTIFAALGVINAFNLIDGMDGVAGSVFLVAAAGMALFAGLSGQLSMLGLLLLCCAGVAGFLALNARAPWNPRARIFLGDSGSMPLGFLLAWCFIALGNDRAFEAGRAMMPMTAVWLFAVPLLDTTTQIWRRWRAGLSPFGGDQYHLHHAFLRAGFTVGQAWAGITLLAVLLGGTGVLFELAGVPDFASFWIFIVVAVIYYHYMRLAWERQRFLRRHFIYNEFDQV